MKLADLVGSKITAIKKIRFGIEIMLDDDTRIEIIAQPDEADVDIEVSKFRYQREMIGRPQKITE